MNKSHETPVTYETAVIARDKGFDEEVKRYFCLDKDNSIKSSYNHHPIKSHGDFFNGVHVKGGVSRPTKYQLKDWLWEKYGVWIEVEQWADGTFSNSYDDRGNASSGTHTCPKECLEAALQKALKEIKI